MNPQLAKIGLLGASGRMGSNVSHLLSSEFAQQGVLAAQANQNDPLDPLLKTDVVIDFSSPGGMTSVAQVALQSRDPLPSFVIGSTGWSAESRKTLETLSKKTAVLIAANFSPGVQILSRILREYAAVFKTLQYTPAIIETHHEHKKDSPSGTALALRRDISPASPESVQTLSLRAGEIIGEHEILFFGKSEKITFSHVATDRALFARGALQVALWLVRERSRNRFLSGMMSLESYFDHLKENAHE